MGLAGEEDTPVLDCYWLALWYHQSPEHFLAMPLSDVAIHVARTARLLELKRRAQQDQDEDGA